MPDLLCKLDRICRRGFNGKQRGCFFKYAILRPLKAVSDNSLSLYIYSKQRFAIGNCANGALGNWLDKAEDFSRLMADLSQKKTKKAIRLRSRMIGISPAQLLNTRKQQYINRMGNKERCFRRPAN